MSRRLLVAAGGAVVISAVGWIAVSRTSPGATAHAMPRPAALHVPRASSPITIDGEPDDRAWRREAARTNAFLGEGGKPAIPFSEARFAWGDGALYLWLYAADIDVRTRGDSADRFSVRVDAGGRTIDFEVTPLGELRGAAPEGTRVAHDLDGEPDDPRGDDEEWIVEMAIPLASLGLRGTRGETLSVAIERCDTPRSGARVCGSFGRGGQGTLALE